MTTELLLGCFTLLTLAAVIIVTLTTSSREKSPYREKSPDNFKTSSQMPRSD